MKYDSETLHPNNRPNSAGTAPPPACRTPSPPSSVTVTIWPAPQGGGVGKRPLPDTPPDTAETGPESVDNP